MIQSQGLRQTTLWGQTLREEDQLQSQPTNSRPYRADLPLEVPTHHALNTDALKTWVYPTNLGPIREYQFSIIKNGLFNNTLVALPTGLGKTFIAATIMLNYFRWTKSAKIIFVAPTKPLVAQQVDACLNVAGIPRSQATRLDGDVAPVVREGEWERKRLFFMTPQTLMNDLSKGYADPKSIVLLVVDEAHRSTGEYAYVKVVEFLRRFSKSFRVLALTATPGSTVQAVQGVVDNLGISHVEIRTEESLDIRQYVHSRNIDTVVLDPSDEIMRIRELFSKALKPLVDKLSSQNIYWGRDPMSLTTYGLLKARTEWMSGPGQGVPQGTKYMMFAVFSILQSLAHSIKLLNFHGIIPFYNNLIDFRSGTEEKGESGSKYKRQITNDPGFQEMMDMIEKWKRLDGFVGHPKISYLCDTLLNHFMDSGEGSSTRAIVFSEYRDSAEEIVRVLNTHKPLVKATVFVGQADSKRTEGMKQKQQIETIEKFKAGAFNVLVATSIGEEGLDIGQVDLIVCYDASASPIRMLQRMGRTGRKRAGNIVLLLMRGKEEDQFAKAKDNYEHIQKLICDGSHFELRHDLSARIVPRDIRPEVNKCHVEIPLENSQNRDLLDPKKTAAALRKKPAKKKFNMPDGVETGFMKASVLGRPTGHSARVQHSRPLETDFLAEKPSLSSVLLNDKQTDQLNRLYRDLPFQQSNMEEITGPNLGAYPVAQRTLRTTVKLKHGEYTKRCVKLLARLCRANNSTKSYRDHDGDNWNELPAVPFANDTDDDSQGNLSFGSTRKRQRPHPLSDDAASDLQGPNKRRGPAPAKRVTTQQMRREPVFLDDEEDEEEAEEGLDGDGDEADEDGGTPPAPARGGSRGRPRPKPSAGIKCKKRPRARNRLKRTGDHIEDLGDDCERTSDIQETDGSDSGGDLVDFIVGDDEVTSSMMRSHVSTSPTTCSPPPMPPPRSKGAKPQGSDSASFEKAKPSFELISLTQTQDSDEDMPDLTALMAKGPIAKEKKGQSLMIGLDEDDDEDVQDPVDGGRKTVFNKRRRVFVEDSDDDE